MACNCGYVDYHIPSCPQWKQIQLSTTTTTYTTTQCPDFDPCEEKITSDCVVYMGEDLECFGIYTGDSATTIIGHILEQLLPNCTTTSTTTSTTTTTTIDPTLCYCITFTNTCSYHSNPAEGKWTDCIESIEKFTPSLAPGESYTVCGSNPAAGGVCIVDYVTGSPCELRNGNYVCTDVPVTPTTSTTTTGEPCICYTYIVVNRDNNASHTFTYSACPSNIEMALTLTPAGTPGDRVQVCVCNEVINVPKGFFDVYPVGTGCIASTSTTTSTTASPITPAPCSSYTIIAPGNTTGTYSFVDCVTNSLVTNTLANLNAGAVDCVFIKSAVTGSVFVQVGSGLLIAPGDACPTTTTTTPVCAVFSLFNTDTNSHTYNYVNCVGGDISATLAAGACISFSAITGSITYEVGIQSFNGNVCPTTTTTSTSTTTTTLALTPVFLSNFTITSTFSSILMGVGELGNPLAYPAPDSALLTSYYTGTYNIKVTLANVQAGTTVKVTDSNGIVQSYTFAVSGGGLYRTFNGVVLNGITQMKIEISI